jgi:hypothetical protein
VLQKLLRGGGVAKSYRRASAHGTHYVMLPSFHSQPQPRTSMHPPPFSKTCGAALFPGKSLPREKVRRGASSAHVSPSLGPFNQHESNDNLPDIRDTCDT